MDISMPVMDGFEATKEIRSLDTIQQENLFIVALTAQCGEFLKETCLHAGMNDFTTKPVNIDVLRSILRKT